MNTVAVDSEGRSFEDFVAIPDLAAGMLAEVLSGTTTDEPSHQRRLRTKELSEKSEIIADWFWYRGGSLKKTCILIDRVDEARFDVGELHMQPMC